MFNRYLEKSMLYHFFIFLQATNLQRNTFRRQIKDFHFFNILNRSIFARVKIVN